MKQQPKRIDAASCREATRRIDEFLAGLDAEPDLESIPERYRDLARRDHERLQTDVRTDRHRDHRWRARKCLRCQYRGALAGAAITVRPCGLCLEPQQYGSTNAGVLCVACASAHGLCAHCGGDLGGDLDRTDYPTSPTAVSAHE